MPAARGSFSRTKRVRETLERGAEWRGTEASTVEAGPSTRTCRDLLTPNSFVLSSLHCALFPNSSRSSSAVQRTRLWSMISAMAASLPAKGPETNSTTRPTSTSLQELASTETLADILAVVGGESRINCREVDVVVAGVWRMMRELQICVRQAQVLAKRGWPVRRRARTSI